MRSRRWYVCSVAYKTEDVTKRCPSRHAAGWQRFDAVVFRESTGVAAGSAGQSLPACRCLLFRAAIATMLRRLPLAAREQPVSRDRRPAIAVVAGSRCEGRQPFTFSNEYVGAVTEIAFRSPRQSRPIKTAHDRSRARFATVGRRRARAPTGAFATAGIARRVSIPWGSARHPGRERPARKTSAATRNGNPGIGRVHLATSAGRPFPEWCSGIPPSRPFLKSACTGTTHAIHWFLSNQFARPIMRQIGRAHV